MTTNTLPNSGRAIVKSVLSGDGVVLRGRPVNGPPPERILSFSNVVAPRLGTVSDPSKEELGAFESREYLRKLLIGKEVSFKVEYTTTTNNRDFGALTLPSPGVDGETNVSRLLVKQGWVKVKSAEGKRAPSDEHAILSALEAAAQAGGLGIWNPKLVTRTAAFNVADPREFLDAHKGKSLPAIVDQVRDANTIRLVVVLPNGSHQYININLTGIKAPVYRANVPNVEDLIEPFSQEAKYFVESRLLQRDVSVVLEGVNNNGVFIASLIHKVGGSIAEALLAEGYASVVSWQVAMVTGGPEKLRTAENAAKEKNLRIWKSFVSKPISAASVGNGSAALTVFDAVVTRIMGADSILVVPTAKPTSAERRIFFSSLRAPPKIKEGETVESGYNHEAKEFLRQKLIGKTVHVVIDFVKPKENGFDEREAATVTLGDINIAEALIARGLATALKHRKDDDNRSPHYDALTLAEDKAVKALKGLHSEKEPPVYRFVDASESASKARNFLPALQRNKTVH
ncbi:UNVERIFIED_CONTAM: nuclease domain-containing protein, partial [Siphonaria sp. JEL0065]